MMSVLGVIETGRRALQRSGREQKIGAGIREARGRQMIPYASVSRGISMSLWSSILLFAWVPSNAAGLDRWTTLTRADLRAIIGTIDQVYPGVIDPDHPAIRRSWQRNSADALARATSVKDEASWSVALRRLVLSLRDPHVSINLPSTFRDPMWTGYAAEYVDGRFFLRTPADRIGSASNNRQIVRCNGVEVAKFVRHRLDLNLVDWSNPGNRGPAVASLLLDTGLPLPPIRSCTVRNTLTGKQQTIKFAWRRATDEDLVSLHAFSRRAAGTFSLVRRGDGSLWIRIANFTDAAANRTIREQLKQMASEIRRAPYVIVDVRGNGGGDSELGRQFIASLWGDGTVVPEPEVTRGKQWRPSPELMEQVAAIVRDSPEQDRESRRGAFLSRLLTLLHEHAQDGDRLIPDLEPADPRQRPAKIHKAVNALPPVLVATDGGCMSSCVMFVDDMVRMGAHQIGDPTNRNTLYGEEWVVVTLPSGRAQLYIPSAAFGWRPNELGGRRPEFQWQGSGADEAGFERFTANHGMLLRTQGARHRR